jgi:hypothetical protein
MSRFTITNAKGTTVAYGHDRPTAQYFLDVVGTAAVPDYYRPVVGFDAILHRQGTAGQLFDALQAFDVLHLIPEAHRIAIGLDLPIPEDRRPCFVHNGDGKPTISVEEQLKPGYVPPCPF